VRGSDEFAPGPLKIFHAARDSQGTSERIRLEIPGVGIQMINRHLREFNTYATLPECLRSLIGYGWERAHEQGIMCESKVFMQVVEMEHHEALLDAQRRLIESAERQWSKAKTSLQRAELRLLIEGMAIDQDDPMVASELRRVIA